MSTERTKYSSSILTSKSPFEATEIVRVRLSQAKLINKDFYLFFKGVSDLKKNYTQQLHKLVAENADLEKMLHQETLDTGVLTPEEQAHYTLNSLGQLKNLWAGILEELQVDLKASTDLYRTLDRDVIATLKGFTENDPGWTESKRLHSKLSQLAASIEYNKSKDDARHQEQLRDANAQWDSEAPFLFELFENTDYGRLLCLKNCLLKYQSGFSDSLHSSMEVNERVMAALLDFNPESEIDRFAHDAMNYKFSLGTKSAGARAPNTEASAKKNGPHHGIGKRLSSTATVVKHDLLDRDFSDQSNNASLRPKKSSHKLRSRVGSIFGMGKLKNKKSSKFQSEAIAESDSSSVRTSNSTPRPHVSPAVAATATPALASVATPVPAPVTGASLSTRQENEEGDSLYGVSRQPKVESEQQDQVATPETKLPPNGRTNSTLSIHQPPLQPQQRDKQLPPEPVEQQQQQQQQPQSQPLHIQAPLPPPSRKTTTNTATNNSLATTSPDASREPHGSVPKLANAVTGGRRDVHSKLFTDLSQPDLEAHAQIEGPAARALRQPSLVSQMTGDLRTLNPQATGSSASLHGASSQSLFQHSELTSFGLNASIAEVLNATFRDGVLESSHLIGEVALNYISDGGELPLDINLRLSGASAMEKVILNQAFIEHANDPDCYKVNPLFIQSKTLGAVKYAMREPVVPIVIHPVWRFEEHQASVMLTVKLGPSVAERVQELRLDDFVVSASIDGAAATSALSKPQGSFSREKRRITWRFNEPLVLRKDGEERLIARFMTQGVAKESDKGIVCKFTIHNSPGGGGLSLQSQEVDADDPFGSGEWANVTTSTTLVAGNYYGLA